MKSEIIELLKISGWDDEEAKKTFDRWYNWLVESTKKEDVKQYFNAIEKIEYDQLVIVKDIDVDLVCPHHLLPVDLIVHIGYLPNGQILGLSKFARVAKALSYPQIQEGYTKQLVDIIFENLKPKWCMAIVIGEHSCMQCRGVRSKNSKTVTSAIRVPSNYPTKEEHLKREFMKLVV